MAQFVGQQRAELGPGQLRGNGAVEYDVGLAGYVGKRGVQTLGILRLVDRQRNVEPELPRHVFGGGIGLPLRFPLHTVRGFQQLEPDRFRLLAADLVRRIPAPDISLFCLEIVAHCLVVRQWL